MAERDWYIPGVPCWVDSTHPDPDAVLPFYSGLFGWDFTNVMPEGSKDKFFMARVHGGEVSGIGSVPEGAPPVARWNTYIWVDSADETAEKAEKAGGNVLAEPFDIPEAGRMAVLADPEGAAISVWQANPFNGAKVVNENGALNFNGLATRDVGAAKAFYGAVFGWRTLSLPFGEMWTLPGYGDRLEEHTPGLRQGMKDMGAPEGFIDVVATLEPIKDAGSQTPAHWRVTFGADDVRAVAAKAKELGGEVVSGPFDAPYTRVATIKDPQGATFSASQFVAENSNLTA